MTEQQFLDSIDMRLPYEEAAAWQSLVAAARVYSANAMFALLEEIARPLGRTHASFEARCRMVAAWREGFDHPLAEIVTSCALARIAERPVEIPLVLSIMRRVAHFPGEYAALNIVAAAANDETVPLSSFDVIDDLDLAIRTSWHAGRRVSV